MLGAAAYRVLPQRRRRRDRARRRLPRAWRSASSIRSTATAIAARVRACDLAVATSGAYERGAHIRDPPDAPRRALGHGHRTGSRHRRRLQHRGVRDGRRRPALDAAASRLRGDDDPRRRHRAVAHRASRCWRTTREPRLAVGRTGARRRQPHRRERRGGARPRDRRRRRRAGPRAARGAARGVPARPRPLVVDALAGARRPRARHHARARRSRPRAPARCAPTAGSRPALGRLAGLAAAYAMVVVVVLVARFGPLERGDRPGPARALAPQARTVAAVPAHRACGADHRRLRAGRARRRAAPARASCCGPIPGSWPRPSASCC